MTEAQQAEAQQEATVWKMAGPYLIAAVVAIGGASLSMISVSNSRELDQHEKRIDELEATRGPTGERLRGIEVEIKYLSQKTDDVKGSVDEVKKSVDGLRGALVGNGR